MAHINFVIPGNKAELLSECDNYYVRNVVVSKDIVAQLKNARVCLRDEGAEFIIDAFDVYYSVLHHGDTLNMDVIYRAYEDLHKATMELNKALGFILEDKDSLNDELKMKFVTILKMQLYIYTQIVVMVEHKNETKNQGLVKVRKKVSNDDEQFVIDKKNVLLVLNNIIQREISLFWDPPVVEENFVNIVSEVCYRFLQNPMIKSEKEVRVEIFSLIGSLIKGYNHGTTFVIRMVQLIKMHEHLVHCLPEGVQQLVQNFNCKGLVHDLIREVTEWQTDEKYQDSQGARYCATVLSSMAVLMPDLMIPEVMYLNKYLAHESVTLRNSVLTVITEVVINVLSNHDLSEEQRESRDEFLVILTEHMDDVAALVRAKVIQHWARLQKESAIPLKYQHQILEKVIEHLYDKGALVRKSAANCVTTFLAHNTFSANLSQSIMQKELVDKQKMLGSVSAQFEDIKVKRLEEIEIQWNSKKNDLKMVIEEELGKEKDKNEQDNAEEDEINQIPKDQVAEIIRLYLNEGKYKDAFKLCQIAGEQIDVFQQFRENNEQDETELYLLILRSVFINVNKLIEELKTGNMQGTYKMTEDDFKKMEVLETAVDFLQDCVAFLKLIDSAIVPMTELLETTAIGDMHEAIEFFISAYQFNIDNASVGILAMLKIMQRNEQERKEHIVKAFKTIYLNTDTTNMEQHCSTIVKRLVTLVKTVPINNVDDLQLIIADWTAKGVLDNSIIDMLWQYFTKKMVVTDEDARAAVELLRMCALGRKTIITRNIKLVATIAFGERGDKDMLLLGSACELLSVAGKERIDITSKNPPFKIKAHDEIFKNLLEILQKRFFEPVEYYNKALHGSVDFIYKLCSKPEKLCEDLIDNVVNKLAKNLEEAEDKNLDKFIIVRLCQLLGYVAIKHLEYLDETVYKELKRRNNIREERKEAKKSTTGSRKSKKHKQKPSISATANESSLNTSVADESTLEGAQAEDTDAEFILNVLENDTVTGSGGLGKLAYIVKGICERPNIYDDVMIQGAAVIALIRYMLVSSKFCSQNIQLLFTIFEKTLHPEVKCSILVHLSDLLTRFPNIIEPWTPRIYQRLKDPLDSIRKATFFTLSNLILRDMIRAHSHISEMVCCLVDEDKELNGMCKTFFVNLSHKENNLYNVLPDIFSHLMDVDTMSEEDIRGIMKFLFELMDKTKHMENLVDRFCCKFRLSEDVRHHRNITYCLSLIHYNEKALRKLLENFPTYKHLVHDPEIYASFRNIMQNCNKAQVGKADLKLNEDGNLMKPPPVPPKSTRKPRSRLPSKKRARARHDSDSEEEFEDSEKENANKEPPARRSNRSQRSNKRVIEDSDSD
ncbi:hypothetical protein NQ314_011165 [Rhamnusium bicolor]|uniref:Condensin complex subunit 1 n=1 Tax=Rhamnusium bicolor TaxID=1586634 RepID=A0AAV8XLB0_9CUCU|nr:hypothetical protein NQ314_011165 [Rhamnusium bicolor]